MLQALGVRGAGQTSARQSLAFMLASLLAFAIVEWLTGAVKSPLRFKSRA